MPLPPRTIALAAAADSRGIRCYTKTTDGDIREACNNLSAEQLSQALKDNNIASLNRVDGWTSSGTLDFKCHRESTLCTVMWKAGGLAMFYQNEKGVLCERRFVDGKWSSTGLKQEDAQLGTTIAAVVSLNGEKTMIFFQDTKGHLCCQRFDKGRWQPKVKRAIASLGTGIGATAWDNLQHIRVYYQDTGNNIREYCGSFSDEWSHTRKPVMECDFVVGDITAVSWATPSPQLRLFLQDKNNKVIEMYKESNAWTQPRGYFCQEAFPNADVIAFARNTDTTGPNTIPCLYVMWAGQDQILYQSVSAGNGWLEPAGIAYLVGAQVGSWTHGTVTTDDVIADENDRILSGVSIRSDTKGLFALKTIYDNEDTGKWRGGESGQVAEFLLAEDEAITQVWYTADKESIKGIQFVTSSLRKSSWFGTEKGAQERWYSEGRAIVGFTSCTSDAVTGLAPIWSAEPFINAQADSKRIALELDASLGKIKEQFATIDGKKKEFERGWSALNDPKRIVVQELTNLAEAVEYFHDMSSAKEKTKIRSTSVRQKDLEKHAENCQARSTRVKDMVCKLAGSLEYLTPIAGELQQLVKTEVKEATSNRDSLDQLKKSAADHTARRKEAAEDMRGKVAQKQEQDEYAEGVFKTTYAKYPPVPATLDPEPPKRNGRGGKLAAVSLNLFASPKMVEQSIVSHHREARDCVRVELGELCTRLQFLNKELASAENLEKYINDQVAQLETIGSEIADLSSKVDALQATSVKFFNLVEKLHNSSAALVAGGTPQQFAQGLLPILDAAVNHEDLKQYLTLDGPVLVATVAKIARGS